MPKIAGLRMSWDSPHGAAADPDTHANSFWVLQEDTQDAARQTIAMRFRCWDTQAAHAEGCPAMGSHSYTVTTIEPFPPIMNADDLWNYKYQAILAADPFFAAATPRNADGSEWTPPA